MNWRLSTLSFFALFLFAITFGNTFLSSVEKGGTLVMHTLGAQVGISVGIQENEYTHLAQQITDKVEELNEREEILASREAELNRREEVASIFSLEVYVTVLAFILLILVLLNFYLDWRRSYYGTQNI